MKKFSIIILAAAMGLLASCVKENANTLIGGASSLEVSIASKSNENPTRTHMGPLESGKRKVYWSNGDAIAVNGTASDALSGLGDEAVKANFTFATPVSAPFNIVYPASIYEDATHVTLPATQDFSADGFAEGMFPMVGFSADGSAIAVHHLCSVLKLNLKRSTTAPIPDEDQLWTVSFSGGHNEQVSGSFEVDYEHALLIGTSTATADLKVKTVQKQATSTSSVTSYTLVVPAGEYQDGFTFEILDENADKMIIVISGPKVLEAGRLYDINASGVEFIPNDQETGIEISTPEELIAFATAYNAKTYESQGNTLIATVVADLAFDATTSAAFNATGGIGLKESYGDAEDFYFSGLFNGDGHTISGLQATVPLFKATGSNGSVKNLTIDNSCSFTFTHPNTAEANFGAVVNYHKGLLEDITVAADVALAPVADVQYMTSLGGLVGRATVGQVKDCEYSGLISAPEGFTATPPADDPNTRKLIIGGLVGRFSNDGSVSGSYFKGAISSEAQIKAGDSDNRELKDNPYLIIGGVVGHVAGGATVSTTNTTADHATVGGAGSYSTVLSSIVNKSTVAYNSAVGGIVGELNNGSVSDCANAATIFNTVFKASDKDVNGRYMQTGGIVGKVDKNGSVSGCTNNATVRHRSNPKMQYLGGIAGYNAGSLSSCSNTAAVGQMTSGQSIKAGRQVRLGGVIGYNASSATVSDVHNSADIEISSMEDNTASSVYLGGVIADNAADLDGGSTKNITNSGQVYFSPTMTTQFEGYKIGGVVGSSSASLQNVVNTGYVYFRWNSGDNNASKIYLGGIVGYLSGSDDLTVSGCENNHVDSDEGKVHLRLGPGSDNYVSGILGYSATNVAISSCTNNGLATCQLNYVINGVSDSEATPLNTGVAGILGGFADGKTASISDCTNNGEVFFDINGKGGTQNKAAGNFKDTFVGGILAKGAGASLSGCTNAGYVHGGNSTRHNGAPNYIGGIVAYLTGDSEILNCSNTGNVTNMDNNNTDTIGSTPLTGGIAGYVEGSSSDPIVVGGTTGCSVDANINGNRGWCAGAVAYAKYAAISKCSVVQLINSAARQVGGVVGKAEDCTISASSFNAASIKGNNVHDHLMGGIVAKMENTAVDGCSSYVTTMLCNTPSTDSPFEGGAIVGDSGSGNTIQDCHYKPTINGEAANIAGTGTYTGSGNTADL